jgi:hypothetical protein
MKDPLRKGHLEKVIPDILTPEAWAVPIEKILSEEILLLPREKESDLCRRKNNTVMMAGTQS